MKVRILVLNYNGRVLLEETIPTLMEACRRSRFGCQLSIIDNDSRDSSVSFLKEFYPSVQIIPSANRVLCSFNEALSRSQDDIVILLNNDLKVHPDFVDYLAEPFGKDPTLFLVAPKCMDYDGVRIQSELCEARLSFGILRVASVPVKDPSDLRLRWTFGAGSAAAYDRKKFLQLGGYDELYLPGTMEDIDLCFKAWRMGFHCLYQPRSVVYHKGQASFHREFGSRRTRVINARNNYLFVWKNLSGTRLHFWHCATLPLRWLSAVFTGNLFWIQGWFEAMARRGQAQKGRDGLRSLPWSYSPLETIRYFKNKIGDIAP